MRSVVSQLVLISLLEEIDERNEIDIFPLLFFAVPSNGHANVALNYWRTLKNIFDPLNLTYSARRLTRSRIMA